MIANYHTHTYRCQHADGCDEEYVKKAITEGLDILGFSDHGPYYAVPDSSYKMKYSEIPEYFASVLSLREKYADKIEIPLGFEIEYYKDDFLDTLRAYREYPPEYLILGQHFVGRCESRGELGVRSPSPTDDEAILRKYADEIIAGMETENFSILAHPDIINFVGSPKVYEREMRRVIRAARETGTYIEYNLLGMSEKRSYPTELFWTLAADEKMEAVIGCDAHSPSRVADAIELSKANGYLSALGIKVCPKIELRKPKLF